MTIRIAMATSLAATLLFATPALAQQGERALASLAEADSNHDGEVSRAEFQAQRAVRFDRLDRNGDGRIAKDDLPARGAMQKRLMERMAPFDRDRDGAVTRAEFAGGPTPAFDRIDADGNGMIDTTELARARAARR